jgi:putative ABC transport system substrate-binding protein
MRAGQTFQQAKQVQTSRLEYVDKILRGARPADLPVEAPTELEFVINLKTAQGLGLTISPRLQIAANELLQ